MASIRFGVVGTGKIADFTARAISQADSASLSSVASRRHTGAKEFAREHGIPNVYPDWRSLVEAEDSDAIYVASPTTSREEICFAALANHKHLLCEKPFLNTASVDKIAARAQSEGLAFMDATHFTHHPRTARIIQWEKKYLGQVNRVRSAFFIPMMDRDNIRFNSQKEPTGAIGDIGWYNMRAIVEYMRPTGAIKTISGAIKRDSQTGTIISGAGLIEFASGQTSTFDFGYDSGVWQMDLDILGENGLIQLDNFVLDWRDSAVFYNPEYTPEFVIRRGEASPDEFEHQQVPIERSQAVQMIEDFCHLTTPDNQVDRIQAIERARATQSLIDQYCLAVGVAV
ncbi:Gfo/Idh/MocA family protein [Microbulbifer sp. EKSA008]|uniref:Gfo/Idh/MocA family protein n=1 Tax=Microbulbifer sp. EKSA008 TaxID=3243367 RepID=UPI0040425CC9